MYSLITNGVLKSSWWLFLVGLILFAVYLSLGRLAAHSVSRYEAQIEVFLHNNGLEFVDIGAIEGRWRVHDPEFTVSNIMLAPDGEPVLAIDYLTLRIDSLRSLFYQSPIVTDMTVSGIRFSVAPDADGLWIKGLARTNSRLDFNYILDSLPYLEELTFEGVDILLQNENLQTRLTSRANEPWAIREQDDVKTVQLPIYLQRAISDDSLQTNRVSLSGFYVGDLREADFLAELFIDTSRVELEDFLPLLPANGLELSSAKMDASVWLRIDPNSVDLTADIQLADVSAGKGAEQRHLAEELKTRFRFHGESLGKGSANVPELILRDGEYQFELPPLLLTIDSSGPHAVLAGKVETVAIAEVVELLDFVAVTGMISGSFAKTLATVAPKGELQEVLFVAGLDEDEKPRFVSRISDFSMQAYLGVPAIKDLNGLIAMQSDRGYLDIDNDEFELNFSNMFSQAWPFDSGGGRVSFLVTDDGINISTGLIELIQGDLVAYGKLLLKLPPAREDQTWGLTIGISDAALLDVDRYIPNTIPADLSSWLQGALLAGQSRQTGLTFHGSLFRGSPAVRKSHDLYFGVTDASVEYHPEWPPLEAMTGTVYVNNYAVSADNMQGSVYDLTVNNADLLVPISADGKVDTVLVDASATGDLSNGLRLLRDTPLADLTSDMARQWSGSGALAADLSINVPLGERVSDELLVSVDTSVSDSLLMMSDFQLEVADLAAQISYSSDAGLSAQAISGQLLGHAMQGSVATQVQGDSGEIVLTLAGKVDAPALYDWSDQLLLSRAQGTMAYDAAVHIPYGGKRNEPYVVARSNLDGVSIDLPAPLDKPDADSSFSLEYRQFFIDDGYRVELNLDDRVNASLKIEDGIAVGGRIHFGDADFGAVTYDGIRMTGDIEFLDFEQWLDTTEALSELSEVSLQQEIAEHVETLQLDIESFQAYGLTLEDVDALVTREQSVWQARLENEMLSGLIGVPDDPEAALSFRMDRLSLESDEDSTDPFLDVSPNDIPNADFSTALLLIDGEDYGSWSFEFRNQQDEPNFRNLSANTMGLEIAPGSSVNWRETAQGHESEFVGEIEINDLATTLRSFGFASSIEGEDLEMTAALAWGGSPAMIEFLQVSGTVELREGSGRFVQAETGGALKLLGVFDFASLSRRFRLDFSDVVDKGLEFSDISGVVGFEKGRLNIKDPIVVDGSSGKFTVAGTVDLNSRVLDNDMIVTLPVSNTLPWYAAYSAIATGPLVGAGVILAQRIFEDQINQMSSAKYKIGGTIEEPDIEFVSIFSDSVREAEGAVLNPEVPAEASIEAPVSVE